MKNVKIQYLNIDELTPYAQNARKHGETDVAAIRESIRAFGFNDPVGVWGDQNIIVEGHGRVLAARQLGMTEIPCIRLDHLTDEERRAYTLAHNKTAELSDWDFDIQGAELRELTGFDMTLFGFEYDEDSEWFQREETDGTARQEGNDEYNAFVEKFEIKKTTDDCYTPENIYDAVADWVAEEYGLDRANFVRPFYPGGDYQARMYSPDDVVVDNPPFSILAQICRWYIEKGIRFFLFAPTLTLFSADCDEMCNVCANCKVTFENGANVNIGFKTNLENGCAVRTAPSLFAAVDEAERENTQSDVNLLKYEYPANVVTAAKVSNWAEAGVDFSLPRAEVKKISAIDAQKEKNLGIFGSGFLLSDAQAAKAAKAATAAKAAIEAGVPIEDINEDGAVVWKLSERELAIVAELNKGAVV